MRNKNITYNVTRNKNVMTTKITYDDFNEDVVCYIGINNTWICMIMIITLRVFGKSIFSKDIELKLEYAMSNKGTNNVTEKEIENLIKASDLSFESHLLLKSLEPKHLRKSISKKIISEKQEVIKIVYEDKIVQTMKRKSFMIKGI